MAMKEWFENEARRFYEDRSSINSRIISRTATLLIAANVAMGERKQLMEMADEMSDLRPSVSKPLLEAEFNSFLKQLGKPPLKADYKINLDRHGMSESDRIANISDIEKRFKELCRRNSIAPEEPLTPEMQKRAQQVISDLKQAAAPIEVTIKRLREEIDQKWQSASEPSATDRLSKVEEWKILMKKYNELCDIRTKMHYLGSDSVDLPIEFD